MQGKHNRCIEIVMEPTLLKLALLVWPLLFNCKAPANRSTEPRPPVVRVGIIEQRRESEFRVDGRLSFVKPDGSFPLRGIAGGHWKVEAVDTKPAEFIYRLAVGTTKDRFAAERIVDSVERKGLHAEVKRHRRAAALNLRYAHKAVYQVFLEKTFASEDEAKLYQNAIRKKTNSEIVAVPAGKPQGKMRFTSLDNNYSFDSSVPVKVSAVEIEIADVDAGRGFHWESSEHRSYSGTIEYLLDNQGLLTVVNEISLEEYLKGVVPSEMPPGFPYESLKAQAVAARVEAIAKIGMRHPFEPFDLCDDVHCQVYSGNSRKAERSDMAVESTRGIFMVHRGKLIEAFYAGVCGGHTENNENVWLIESKPYLRGVLDRAGKHLSNSLQEEDNAKKWIDSSPDVYCNTTRGSAPKSLNYSKKYFRWQVTYEREVLEQIIQDKTGENFGVLLDLIPLKRGVSGRIIELEVVGSLKRFVITKELAIRQALAKSTLFSANFYVQKKGRASLGAGTFVLKGAGWGHGVGMCQVGAAMMAESGKKFDEILTHYYKGVFLEKLYN